MLYTTPDYFDQFKCIAGECQDTCCSGWQIVIDEEKLDEYKSGKYSGINMDEYVDFEEGVFRQSEDRRCAFLKDDNLCRLCAEHGEEALCRTCHLYPRHIEEFENVRETSLSLSCPEVSKMILSRKERVSFNSTEDDAYEEYDDFDFVLYSSLLDARDAMIKFVQNRAIPIDERAGMILGLCHDMDKRLGDGRFHTIPDLIEYFSTSDSIQKSYQKIEEFKNDKEKYFDFIQKKFGKLIKLEPIGYDWINLYTESEYLLYKDGSENYFEWTRRFEKQMKVNDVSIDVQLEQLLVYFIFTYFCGAVYDGNIYGKGKLCVFGTYLIKELWKAAFIKNDGTLSEEEKWDIALRFSRELEHSDENLLRIEKF